MVIFSPSQLWEEGEAFGRPISVEYAHLPQGEGRKLPTLDTRRAWLPLLRAGSAVIAPERSRDRDWAANLASAPASDRCNL